MSATPLAVTGGRTWVEQRLGGVEKQTETARRATWVSGAIVAVCTLVLIADYGIGVWRGAGQTARIVGLEGQTKEDAEAAAVLHEERKGHTDGSLARETRGRALAWMLLFAGAAFVGAGKWWVSLRPEGHPSLEELVAARFARPLPGGGGAQETGSAEGARGEGGGNVAPEAEGQDGRFGRGQDVAPETQIKEFVDHLIGRFGRGQEPAIPILQAIQERYRYLPDEALQYVCEKTEITPAQIAGTSSFYSQFRRSPVGRHVVKVCHGTACHVAGADQITDELRRHLEIPPDADTDDQRLFTVDKVACLGCCSLAPVMMIEEDTAGRLTPATARQALDAVAKRS